MQWADLCAAHAKEALWYHTGYKPTMEEYMENGWVSISAHNILDHIFFLITNPIEKEATQSLGDYHNIIHYSAILLRLADDLGTSPVRTNYILLNIYRRWFISELIYMFG